MYRYLLCFAVFTVGAAAQEPCRSGLQPGVRPGPYSQVVVTGPHRGSPFCFICDTADKPAAIVFARQPTDELGKLLHGIDLAVAKNNAADMRAWTTFLNEDQASIDGKIVKWAQKHALKSVHLGVFEDAGGPPSYKLARDAEVTVLLSFEQKVVHNFAFRSGELTEVRIEEVLKALQRLGKK
jgi:hypothetical protein